MELLTFPVTLFETNCYVIRHEGQALVIDPGEGTPALLKSLENYDVTLIVNTHCHCDHSGGNAAVIQQTGAPLACHAADLPLLRSISEQGRMFGVPFPSSPDPDRLLNHGDILSLGDLEFEVRHTPGHSPGHVVLIAPGIALVGDVLFAGSIGRTDLPGGSMKELLHSIHTQLMTLPDETKVYSGHGPATTIGEERINNPFLVK
ncbi:MAG TPA: MBL fold metallo-hydrolase [Candidatus Hydrogenedentes bacterium]|jgi:glyoxylase-like metal-dependent hydrolase (beta-lactamase superfamily II)|nr:MAG: putative metallo-hydrolase [Candidatus Hydrogenedentes bacterium ADurb.Bin170]HNZ49099.1 MBL fold metallo-hydrolase [Candidatus Hydrogenedentota bacterium]HOD94958.1 MBL fold metallo-hydrolase [Candidatus Hydrogenedentota bacterium]HOH43151.1 MBL fold metallo-hydrolase [Candidatus Hydrogenedentota bacterium]HOM49562.1 MBL fold metallo-hydrolase [Candidatus Hydrogenedentota bacterium]